MMVGRRHRDIAWLTACVLAAFVAPTGVAQADGPTLGVSNLGQDTAPIGVGQPPLAIASAGSCEHPFTIAHESACTPGTWPPLGAHGWSTSPDRWQPTEDVAGGDTLRLAFSTPVSSVSVGSTSNYEPGLHDPDGNPVGNYDVVPESAAVSTADPAVWTATLPPLDYRAISGYTFSVVGQDESGFHDYPFEIRSPRYADELTKCGTAYFSTGVQQGLCPSQGIPTRVPQLGHRKRHRCRKGFRKRVVRGKRRCVRVRRKHHHKRRHHSHRPRHAR